MIAAFCRVGRRPRLAVAWIMLVGSLVTQGCASAPRGALAETWVREELYLGSSIPGGGEVSAPDWERFVEEEIAPRFPEGFTLLEAQGRWQHADGSDAVERTRLFVVVRAAGDTRADKAIAAIAEAYKLRFRQEAVLRITDRVEARF